MDTKYDTIGTGYNSTRQADPFLLERLLFHLEPKSEKLYLDIGCGTGNYTIRFAERGLHFIGVEPSEKMLDEAKPRNQKIDWRKGTAEQIPADDKIFDGIIATLTIHHWSDLRKGFMEMSRVLDDKGRIVVFTSTPEQMKGYWLNHYFPKMLQNSISQMPSTEAILESLEGAKLRIWDLEKYFIKDELRDCFLYVGKNRPEYYFDEKIRGGISSFSSLANAHEVKEGLAKLRKDLESGDFEKVKRDYANDLGDYLFITLQKKEA